MARKAFGNMITEMAIFQILPNKLWQDHPEQQNN
jgi:hypothetical protein